MKMIDIKNIKKHTKCLYYPTCFTSLHDTRGIVYFAFCRKLPLSHQEQYVFTKNNQFAKGFRTYDDMIKAHPEYDCDFDNFIFINTVQELDEIYLYSDSLYSKFNQRENYFQKYEKKYIRYEELSKMYSNGNESFYGSKFYERLHNHLHTYKIRFNIKLCYFCICIIMKYIIFPFMLLWHILKNSLQEFTSYKRAESELNYYLTNSYERKAYYFDNISKDEWEKKKTEKENQLQAAKKTYINSSISIFTLLIAFLSLLISLISNTATIRNTQRTNSQYLSKIADLETANQKLSTQLEIERTQNTDSEILLLIGKILQIETEIINSEKDDIHSSQKEILEIKENLKKLMEEESTKS